MKDSIPVEAAAELSLENVLSNIRFRGDAGYVLVDYNFSPDFTTVELEFAPRESGAKTKKQKG